jgi:peptidyl-prolyl cis-trans isomerase A (cyclophilin A)
MNDTRIGRRSLLAAAALWMARPLRALAAPAAAKPRVAIQTDHGTIVVELETAKAPITAGNFLRYVDGGKYDGGTFYRASRTPGVPGAGSIQGSASQKARLFRPVAHESTQVTGLKHRAGTISLARNKPGSATSDFFICASPQPYLDAHPGAAGDNQGFAAFGNVVEGMAVVKKILAMPTPGKTDLPEMRGQMLEPKVQIISMKRLG